MILVLRVKFITRYLFDASTLFLLQLELITYGEIEEPSLNHLGIDHMIYFLSAHFRLEILRLWSKHQKVIGLKE